MELGGVWVGWDRMGGGGVAVGWVGDGGGGGMVVGWGGGGWRWGVGSLGRSPVSLIRCAAPVQVAWVTDNSPSYHLTCLRSAAASPPVQIHPVQIHSVQILPKGVVAQRKQRLLEGAGVAEVGEGEVLASLHVEWLACAATVVGAGTVLVPLLLLRPGAVPPLSSLFASKPGMPTRILK